MKLGMCSLFAIQPLMQAMCLPASRYPRPRCRPALHKSGGSDRLSVLAQEESEHSASMATTFPDRIPINDHSGAVGAANTTLQLGFSPSVPIGMKHLVDFNMMYSHSAGASFIYVNDPDVAAGPLATMTTATAGTNAMAKLIVWCHVNSFVNVLTGNFVGNFTVGVSVNGYWDYRGKED